MTIHSLLQQLGSNEEVRLHNLKVSRVVKVEVRKGNKISTRYFTTNELKMYPFPDEILEQAIFASLKEVRIRYEQEPNRTRSKTDGDIHTP